MKKILFILSMLAFVGASGQISQTFKNMTVLDTLKTGSDSTLYIRADLVPTNDSLFDLGTDSLRWNKIYADTVDANVIDGVTYPDSSVLFVGSDGKPTTDSNDFAWKGTGLYLLNRNGALTSTGALIITGNATSTLSRVVHSISNNSASTEPIYQFYRSAGSLTAPSATTNSLRLGSINFGGYYGTAWSNGSARITAVSGGTWSSTTINPAYFQFVTGDANAISFTTTLTQKGTLAIKGTNADSAYDLTVNGTAAITQTPENSDLTDSLVSKDDTTGQLKTWRPMGEIAVKNDTNTFAGAYITTTPEIAVGAAGVSFLVTDATTQVQSMPFEEGVYVPDDSAASNLDDVTLDTAGYKRIGNSVEVWGVVSLDPTTTATPTFFYMSLPIFPIDWNINRAGGTFQSYSVNEGGGIILGGPTRVVFQFDPTSTGANVFSYSFTYRLQ